METIYFLMIGLYGAFILFIFSYSLMQANLIINYLKAKRDESKKRQVEGASKDSFNSHISTLNLPIVTIQLPVFNEKYVVERLIESIINFEYPIEKLEIQVLDDSTDNTLEIVANKVKEVRKKGFDIIHITRTKRHGYKAGALAAATALAKGKYIAIFDADFLPKKDFLTQTIPHFADDQIGAVQTRWGHLNNGYSTLTSLQSFALDAHFTIEQKGRNSA